jgi:hemerythrin-like metal-binding protein
LAEGLIMSFFEWSAVLDLRVPKMDAEHQRLIAIMNRLHTLRETQAVRATHELRVEMARVLDDLVSYTTMHFAHEEAYMASIHYARRDLHAELHRRLLARLVELSAPFTRGGLLGADFFDFLKSWLVSHIKGLDMQYADASRAGAHP